MRWIIFLLLIPIVLGQQIGVAPSVLQVEEEMQVIVFNQNPYAIEFSVSNDRFSYTFEGDSIDGYGKKLIFIKPKEMIDREEMITITFGSTGNGLPLHPSLSVVVEPIIVEEGSVEIQGVVNQFMDKYKRDIGPVVSFLIVLMGLGLYYYKDRLSSLCKRFI